VPNLSRFTMCRGKIYCYNDATGRIVEVKLEDMPLTECPEAVVLSILRRQNQNKVSQVEIVEEDT